MDPRIKAAIGGGAGVIAGTLAIALGEMVLHSISPWPASVNVDNPEAVKTYLQTLPASNWMMLVAVYILGGLVAGFVTNLVSNGTKYRPALIAGAGLMSATVLNFMDMGGHPTWVWIASIFGILAGAWFGGSLVRRAA
jgi:hypothetical protein